MYLVPCFSYDGDSVTEWPWVSVELVVKLIKVYAVPHCCAYASAILSAGEAGVLAMPTFIKPWCIYYRGKVKAVQI